MSAEPSAPHELPPTSPEPEAPVEPQALDEPMISEETAQELYEAFSEEQESPDGRQRDAGGRFVSAEPAPEAEPAVDPAWAMAAKDLYFSDEEIASFPNTMSLQGAIVARRAEMQQRMAPAVPPAQPQVPPPGTPPTNQPEQPAPLEDLKLSLPDAELPDEVTGPLKEVTEYVNRLKESLVAENQQLKKAMVGLVQHVDQTANASQSTNHAQEWDQITDSVPGMAEVMGKPSEAARQPGTIQHTRWAMLQPVIRQVTEKYVAALGPERIDATVLKRITKEAFVQSGLSGLSGTANGTSTERPGAVPRPSSRKSSLVSGTSGMPEHDAATGVMAEAWNQHGGNPFVL